MSTLPSVSKTQAPPQHEFLTGVVERLTYHSEESGYTVARFKTAQSRDKRDDCRQLR